MLAYNAVEWLEIYAATAKAGLVMVPINFRLVGPEIGYIVTDSGARALIVQEALLGAVEDIRAGLPPTGALCPFRRHTHAGRLSRAMRTSSSAPRRASRGPVDPASTWAFMYTSGTPAGRGRIRSHRAAALLSLVTDIELGFSRRDTGLLVMPMCHANSLYFATRLLLRRRLPRARRAELRCRGVARRARGRADLHLAGADAVRDDARRARGGPCAPRTSRVTKLMISSAPARAETKQAVMEFFPRSGLFELYGSTEAGWVTMLQPEEQFLSSARSDANASAAPGPLLDEDGNDVADGEVGELFRDALHLRRLLEPAGENPSRCADRIARLATWRGATPTASLSRRPQEQHDHLRRREHLSLRGRSSARRASGREGGRGHRPPDPKWGERVHGVVVLASAVATEPS